MKSYYKMIKPWDIIVVFSLVLLSFIPFFIFSFVQAQKTEGTSVNTAVISVDGKKLDGLSLLIIHQPKHSMSIVQMVDIIPLKLRIIKLELRLRIVRIKYVS